MNPTVSIIIVNYNTAKLVKDCIDSIYAHTHGVGFEVIVVDNCSQAEDLAILKTDNRCHLIVAPENLGFGRANNLGTGCAKGDYVFLLNPDTLLVNDAVSILYHYLAEHPTVGVAGGNLFDKDMNRIHSFHRLLPGILSEMDFALKRIFRYIRYGRNWQHNYNHKPLRVAMITGADMMMPRKVWDEVKGFDPSFFMYCEDADLCKRVADAGYQILCVPDAKIIHLEGQSFFQTEARYRRIYEGRNHYFHKHYSATYNHVSDSLNIFMLRVAMVLCVAARHKLKAEEYGKRLKIYQILRKEKGSLRLTIFFYFLLAYFKNFIDFCS